jgi:hypothetical protein
MKKLFNLLFVSVMFLFGAENSFSQTIGLYFDENGTQPYLENLQYPAQLQLYLIAKNLDQQMEVGGWELSLSWTDSLIVNVSSLEGQALNVLNFPDMMVGVGGGVEISSGQALLANFSVVALGPGRIFVSNCSVPSIIGAEVPIYLDRGNLGTFELEYGGLSQPTAAIGEIIESSNAANVVIESQISTVEFRDGSFFASYNQEKSYVELPTESLNNFESFSEEQKMGLRLYPSFEAAEFGKTKSNGQVLFEDDFQSYVADSGQPFSVPTKNPVKKINSGSQEDDENCRSYWGVITDPLDPLLFNKVAFVGATFGCGCTSWSPQGEGGDWYSYNTSGFYEGMWSTLTAVNDIIFENRTYRLEFDCQTEWLDQGGDILSYGFSYFDSYSGNTIPVPLGYIDFSTIGKLKHDVTFTGFPSSGFAGKFWIEFISDYDGSASGGVYIDNLTLVASDSDLVIEYAQAIDGVQDAPVPVGVEVRIWNDGNEATGAFPLGYNYDGVFEQDSYGNPPVYSTVSVPSISPGEYVDVVVNVPYSDGGKTYNHTVSKAVYFCADADNIVPETNELNNALTYPVYVYWNVYLPPVILVHGITGGGLLKDTSSGFKRVWGEVMHENINSLIHHQELVARGESTDGEAVGGAVYVPSAYPPEKGFIRDIYKTTIPVRRFFEIGYRDKDEVLVTIPSASGMWGSLIENLIDPAASDGTYVFPETDPIGVEDHEQDLFLFNYDWRLDLNPQRTSISQGSTPTYDRLDSLVTWIQDHHPGAGQLTIVSHSMGGLLVEAYLRDNPGTHGVYRWISLGTPFQGSVKAMATLFGANGMSASNNELAGSFVGGKVGNLMKNYVTGWELLPTTDFDERAPKLLGNGRDISLSIMIPRIFALFLASSIRRPFFRMSPWLLLGITQTTMRVG